MCPSQEQAREKLEFEEIDSERRRLVRELEASRRQLGELKTEYHELFEESVMLRSERAATHATCQSVEKKNKRADL